MKTLNEIKKRYTKKSDKTCNLSCGSNIDFLKIKNGETLLDLGCGRGHETIEAAIQSGPEGKAIGLDITVAMIEKAKSNAEKSRISNVDFIEGDIEILPFDDGAFDAVMSNCVINHAKNKNKVFSEISRVLKKGGRFVISDAVTKEPLPLEIKNNPEARAQCFGGAIMEEEYLGTLKSAGFDNIDILKRREYVKNGYDFISLTIMAYKNKGLRNL
ncbi:MAG: methyltransferase domain-containing protein [Candidatus Humimicrobiaceae bacterium]